MIFSRAVVDNLGVCIMTQKSWITSIDKDPDDPEQGILTFPPELIESIGWKEGDSLDLDIRPDGSIVIHKITDKS